MVTLNELETAFKTKATDIIAYPLPPSSRTLAQQIAALANGDGGYLVFGAEITEVPHPQLQLTGITDDYRVMALLHKSQDMLSATLELEKNHILTGRKQLFAIKVDHSSKVVLFEGKIFKRIDHQLKEINPNVFEFRIDGYQRVKNLNQLLVDGQAMAFNSKSVFIAHYQGILKIIDNLQHVLFPESAAKPTAINEGKLLSRILFCSAIDNFETYLSEVLYEICLARPESMKSSQTITLEQVLKCGDIEEIIRMVAREKIQKLQKGSVKGFIKDNQQIYSLGVIDAIRQDDIEAALQIRHLFTHRNGIVDEKFLHSYQGSKQIGDELQLSIDEMLDIFTKLIDTVTVIDNSAIVKYKLTPIMTTAL